MADAGWENRIVEQREMAVSELQENPHNWRLHPASQEGALADLLSQVGVVQGVVFNQRTGCLVDGHLRVRMAVKAKRETLPVTVVDLSEDEEKLVLATLDPIGALAGANGKILEDIIDSTAMPEGALSALTDSILAPFRAPTDPVGEWGKISDYESGNLAHRSVTVHFRDDEAVARFENLLSLSMSKNAKFTWFPPEKRTSQIDKTAGAE